MSDWIKREAEKIKSQEKTTGDQRNWVMYKQRMIDQKWFDIWRAVIAAMEKEVAKFNTAFSDDQEKRLYLDKPSGSEITVRRGGPTVRTICADASADGISLALRETTPTSPNQSETELSPLPFDLSNGGDVGLVINGSPATIADVAEHILRILLPA